MTKVFISDVSKLNSDISIYKNSVSEYKYCKAVNCKQENQIRLSIGAELLLTDYLGRIPKYKIDSFGKPYGEEVEFNFSHSGNISVCAVSDSPIGVDIEKIRNINLDIAKNKFCPREYNVILNSQNPIDSFFEYWVKKESYLKAIGKGLRIPLNKFDVREIADWEFFFCNKEGYKLCVCAKEQPEFIIK